jgi:hypothetical protein
MRDPMIVPDISGLTPVQQLVGETPKESGDLRQMASDAEAFLKDFSWCGAVLDTYAGLTVPGVVGVFLHHIRPVAPEVDEWLWTVVGDIPPAYIVTDTAGTPDEVIEAYIGEMRAWVEAVQMGQPIDDLIPVNVPATEENALRLDARLRLLEAYLEEAEDDMS